MIQTARWMPISVLFIALFIYFAGYVIAAPLDGLMENQIDDIQTDQVAEYWNKLSQDYGGYFPDEKVPSFVQMIMPGGGGLSFSTVFKGIANFFFHEIMYNGKLLGSIVILSVFSLILETLQNAFERNTVSKVAYSITYMVLIIIAINSFHVAIGYAKSAITTMIDFMLAMIPLLLSLLASLGNLASVAVMHPLIIFMIHTIGTIIYTIVFPLLFFSTVLYIVSSLTDQYKVSQLAGLLRNVSVGILGVVITVFLGVVSIKGAASAVVDGISIRTAKYVAGNFVPVVGRLFSDATDTIISASLLVKNAIGLAGVVILLFLCVFPALKILTLALIYKLCAAIMQPLGSSPITSCLETIGKNMIYIFAALAAVGLMFFLAITVIITAGNVTVMMR